MFDKTYFNLVLGLLALKSISAEKCVCDDKDVCYELE